MSGYDMWKNAYKRSFGVNEQMLENIFKEI